MDDQPPAYAMASQYLPDWDLIRAYGENEPSFGGFYIDNGSNVVFFTEDLERHADALRAMLALPDLLRVDRSDCTWVDLQAAMDRITARLFFPNREPNVVGGGLAIRDGQYVVLIHITDYTDEAAERVRAAAAPDAITVEPGSIAIAG